MNSFHFVRKSLLVHRAFEVIEDGHVLSHARVGALFFHGRDIFGLEIDNARLIASLLHLNEEVPGSIERVRCSRGDGCGIHSFNYLFYNNLQMDVRKLKNFD